MLVMILSFLNYCLKLKQQYWRHNSVPEYYLRTVYKMHDRNNFESYMNFKTHFSDTAVNHSRQWKECVMDLFLNH